MKRIIYTVLTGGYENLVDPTFISEDFDYICFTDNSNLYSSVWKLRPIPSELLNLSKVKQLRIIKICPHKYLPEYDLSIYIDASIDIVGDLNLLLKEVLKDKLVYIPKHPTRDCIYDEIQACVKYKKAILEDMLPQISRYKKEGFPRHFGLVQSGIIIRKHNDPYCIQLMNLWKEEILNNSHRDLLSFNYCLWKTGSLNFLYLDKTLFDSEYFKWYSKHNRKKIMEIKKINPESLSNYCVLGVANTEKGIEIEKEMRTWLEPNYNLIEVWHDGSLFEYPALRYMQDLVKETGKPCLYLHTRGAFNFHPSTTLRTRRMWRGEYSTNKDKYFRIVNTEKPTVACPFTGSEKYTWYNGFVANAAAMKSIPQIEPNSDRLAFERIFKDSNVDVIAMFVNVWDGDDLRSLTKAREYLIANYKNKI